MEQWGILTLLLEYILILCCHFSQAVTYLNVLNDLHDDPGPHLIVCPASVLENWERELKKWCPSFSVIMYHGASRATYSKELSSMSKAGFPPPFNVLLVCYSLFERHRSLFFLFFGIWHSRKLVFID